MIEGLFKKYHISLLILIWILCSMAYYVFHGPKLTFDSYQYLNHAEGILKGDGVGWRYFWYSGYILFLSFISVIPGNSISWIVVFQVLVSGIAAICIYKSTNKLSESNSAAFLSTSLFILWHKIQVWNYFILTESLFISAVAILFYALVHKKIWLVFFLSIIISFIRPVGLLVLAASSFSLLIVKFRKKVVSPVFIGISIIVFILLGILSNKILKNYELIENYSSGRIVYSADMVKDKNLAKGLKIAIPENFKKIEPSEIIYIDVLNFWVANPGYSLNLHLKKLIWFVWDYRPFHSTLHILINTIFLVFLYSFTIFYLKQTSINRLENLWFVVFLIGNILMATFTYLTWEGRFFAPIYPILMILASNGIKTLLKNTSKSGTD